MTRKTSRKVEISPPKFGWFLPERGNIFSVSVFDAVHPDAMLVLIMSAKKFVGISSLTSPLTVDARQTRLELSSDSVVVLKSGIEFRSPTPLTLWAEMTVSLISPGDGGKLQCNGVVVACSGNKHTGYHVSMLFTGISRQTEARLQSMANSDLGTGS